LSSCSTGRSRASKKTSFTHVILPKNKPFFAETLKAGKAVAEPPKQLSAMPILLSSYNVCLVNSVINSEMYVRKAEFITHFLVKYN
jgi:hypothetical protein